MQKEVFKYKDLSEDELVRELTGGDDDYVARDSVEITGAEGMHFKLVLVPGETAVTQARSMAPEIILAAGLAVVLVAQLERIIGHPYLVTDSEYHRRQLLKEVKRELEHIEQNVVRAELKRRSGGAANEGKGQEKTGAGGGVAATTYEGFHAVCVAEPGQSAADVLRSFHENAVPEDPEGSSSQKRSHSLLKVVPSSD